MIPGLQPERHAKLCPQPRHLVLFHQARAVITMQQRSAFVIIHPADQHIHPALRHLPFCLETPNELPGYAREIALMRKQAE